MKIINIKIFLIILFFLNSAPTFADKEKTYEKLTDNVEKSIHTRIESQKKLNLFEDEKKRLSKKYDDLKQEVERFSDTNISLFKNLNENKNLISKLEKRRNEYIEIQKEILPFLENIIFELAKDINEDLPFLKKERKKRVENLKTGVISPEITVHEKYSKVMDALFIEAQYSGTTDVLRSKIKILENEFLADILRLGRVSLFFVSIDGENAGFFNIADEKWEFLSKSHVRPLKDAIKIAKNQKTPIPVLLPIGRLSN